jgi:hypothetical protein
MIVLRSMMICFDGMELILPDLSSILTDLPINNILDAVYVLIIDVGTNYISRV